MSNKIREEFHEAYPEAARFYHEPAGRYCSMRYNDMYDAWTKARHTAKPVAQIVQCRTHGMADWTNMAQHPMLRVGQPTLEMAEARALAEGFRLDRALQTIANEG